MFGYYGSFRSLFLFAFLANLISSTQQQKPTYVHHRCPNTTTDSKDNTYSSNLKGLLASLSSGHTFFANGFYELVAGQSPDNVYGQFLCRGDLSPEDCRDCVVVAANDTLTRCLDAKNGMLFYDKCMVRYADRKLFFDSSLYGGYITRGSQNVTSDQRDKFRDLVFSSLNESAIEAATSSRKFSARKINFSAQESLYGLVQCTLDLTQKDCK